LSLLPDVELILKDQFQELQVAQVVAGGFLQPHVERPGQAGEAQVS
jgi:hypothetical protein